MPAAAADQRNLRIIHVLRAPLGGLFRHVLDLAREQVARGHAVGIIADSLAGGERSAKLLQEFEPSLALGLSRIPMHRNPHPSDFAALMHVIRETARLRPHVVHGHGSKGGFFARAPGLLPARAGTDRPVRAYTPHGGSFNYQPGTALHKIYMGVEHMLAGATDILLFESAYIRGRFDAYAGACNVASRTVWNGIGEEEFVPVVPAADAADFLYVGELRAAKGVDTLLEALARYRAADGRGTAVLVGSGPDEQLLAGRVAALGLKGAVTFAGPLPAHQAFELGRMMIVPSRAESLPYIVLEAAAAALPLIATNVGGIPEIFGPYSDRLIPSDNPDALLAAMHAESLRTCEEQRQRAGTLRTYVHEHFTIQHMVDTVLGGYRDALAAKSAKNDSRGKALAVPS